MRPDAWPARPRERGLHNRCGFAHCDRLALVEDAFLTGVHGDKGGMALVDTAYMEDLLVRLPGQPINKR